MRNLIRLSVLALTLLSCAGTVQAQVSIGITIGPPPPVRVVRVPPPPRDPGFVWIEGYWYPVGNHYKWHDGYWTRPPYEGARWVPPRHDGERFFNGYWDGDHGRFEHRHKWGGERERDFKQF